MGFYPKFPYSKWKCYVGPTYNCTCYREEVFVLYLFPTHTYSSCCFSQFPLYSKPVFFVNCYSTNVLAKLWYFMESILPPVPKYPTQGLWVHSDFVNLADLQFPDGGFNLPCKVLKGWEWVPPGNVGAKIVIKFVIPERMGIGRGEEG